MLCIFILATRNLERIFVNSSLDMFQKDNINILIDKYSHYPRMPEKNYILVLLDCVQLLSE